MKTTIQKTTEQMIRVNHAGEMGAVRIYEGQLAALGHNPIILHMLDQERAHQRHFEALLQNRHLTPTRFAPLWHSAAYALGYLSGKLGTRAAMACTVAVEDVIDQHYREQMRTLARLPAEAPLLSLVTSCHADELEHHHTALENDARHMRGYALFTGCVRAASRLAIFLSKRV